MPATDPPVNLAPEEFLRQLDAIAPGARGIPCSIVLADGRSFSHCLAHENPRFGDKGDWINPNDVAAITECPWRMPAPFARLIRDAGESGMGYHIYIVQLADGNSFAHVADNLTIDLVDFPPGYTQHDVIGVRPHEGRERSGTEGYRHVEKVVSVEYSRASRRGP